MKLAILLCNLILFHSGHRPLAPIRCIFSQIINHKLLYWGQNCAVSIIYNNIQFPSTSSTNLAPWDMDNIIYYYCSESKHCVQLKLFHLKLISLPIVLFDIQNLYIFLFVCFNVETYYLLFIWNLKLKMA